VHFHELLVKIVGYLDTKLDTRRPAFVAMLVT